MTAIRDDYAAARVTTLRLPAPYRLTHAKRNPIAAWLDRLVHDQKTPALLLMPYLPETGAFATALDAVLMQQAQPSERFGHHERALLDPGHERVQLLGLI